MDEIEAKQDEEEFSKSVQFTKMMVGVGAGWIFKELAESAFIRIVKWRQGKTETDAE